MQELPLYANRGQSQALVMSRKRDLLLEAREQQSERLKVAMVELKQICVKHTLQLTGVAISGEELAEVFKDRTNTRSDRHEILVGQFEALEAIEDAAHDKSRLAPMLLCKLHKLSYPPDGGSIRSGPVRPQFEGIEPSHPGLILDKLDNLSEWLDSDTVDSMSPPEKATLAFVRLLEIAPFERGNFRLAHLLLSYFAYRDEYPPLFLRAEDTSTIRKEIAKALKFETKDLVDRLVNAQLASLDHCLQAIA